MTAKTSDETNILDQLKEVIFWLGQKGQEQAMESGDWYDYEKESGMGKDELASDYWYHLSHKGMLLALLLQLPEHVLHDPALKQWFAKREKGYADATKMYIEAFLKESTLAEKKKLLSKRPHVEVEGRKYVLPATYDDSIRERALQLGFLHKK